MGQVLLFGLRQLRLIVILLLSKFINQLNIVLSELRKVGPFSGYAVVPA